MTLVPILLWSVLLLPATGAALSLVCPSVRVLLWTVRAGVVLTAAYLLWMLQRVFFGPLNEKYKGYLDLTGRELFSLVPLAVVLVPVPLTVAAVAAVPVARSPTFRRR